MCGWRVLGTNVPGSATSTTLMVTSSSPVSEPSVDRNVTSYVFLAPGSSLSCNGVFLKLSRPSSKSKNSASAPASAGSRMWVSQTAVAPSGSALVNVATSRVLFSFTLTAAGPLITGASLASVTMTVTSSVPVRPPASSARTVTW